MSRHSMVSLKLLFLALLSICARKSFAFESGSSLTRRHKFAARRGNAIWLSSDPEQDGFLRRFTNPVLDDPFLPLSDVASAQIVAPSLQVFWISLVHAPSPTWLRPIFQSGLFETRGSLLAPTLIHGAGLACCWLLGALAAKAYERKAIDPTVEGGGYGTVFATILKAGAFATGVLILGTQLDLFTEFGGFVQPGESEETDLRLLSAWVEVLNDVIFEASTLASFRVYLAVSTATRNNP